MVFFNKKITKTLVFQGTMRLSVFHLLRSDLFMRLPRRHLATTCYSIVKPGIVGPPRIVPDHIKKPPYADTGMEVHY